MRILLVLMIASIVSPWVIYRKNQKKKLICKEEAEWNGSTIVNSPNSAEADESSEERSSTRVRRDIDIDPIHKEPIIYLGAKSNTSVFIDDGDFDIVSDHLSKKELEYVKKQIMETCNALNTN